MATGSRNKNHSVAAFLVAKSGGPSLTVRPRLWRATPAHPARGRERARRPPVRPAHTCAYARMRAGAPARPPARARAPMRAPGHVCTSVCAPARSPARPRAPMRAPGRGSTTLCAPTRAPTCACGRRPPARARAARTARTRARSHRPLRYHLTLAPIHAAALPSIGATHNSKRGSESEHSTSRSIAGSEFGPMDQPRSTAALD